jgi:hypothetical protein
VAGDPTCGRSDAELVSDEGTGAEAIPEASKAGE